MGEECSVVSNKQVILRDYIHGTLTEADMFVRTSNIQLKLEEGSDAILVKNLYLSCDPFLRKRMTTEMEPGFFIHPFTPGSPISGYGVFRVLDSKISKFMKGDLVWGITGFEEYSVIYKEPQLYSPITTIDKLVKIETTDIALSYYTGLLGMAGFSAYVGFYEICSPRIGENVFISDAAGAVGQLVGQFAKLMGCYVVGSAGTKEKVNMLTNKLGFDDAFNYKDEEDLNLTLKRYFPDGIDIYFENVGGKMLDAVLNNMKLNGRISVSGMISQYNLTESEGTRRLFAVVIKQIRLQGFIFFHYFHLYPKFLEMMLPLVRNGKILYMEDIAEGLESAPAAVAGIFNGHNFGKQVVAVAGE